MKNILIINCHHFYPFSKGRLNDTLVEKAQSFFIKKGFDVKITKSQDKFDVKEEIAKHQWADVILLQTPVNWMMIPWSFKKYMDEVYTAGLDGTLSKDDGRSSSAPKENYGVGGTLVGKKYMLSLTFNAPKEAFDNPSEYLFQGKSIDDLFFPIHMNFRFFGMESLETFACFDVMKNPDIENDFKRFNKHLEKLFTNSY